MYRWSCQMDIQLETVGSLPVIMPTQNQPTIFRCRLLGTMPYCQLYQRVIYGCHDLYFFRLRYSGPTRSTMYPVYQQIQSVYLIVSPALLFDYPPCCCWILSLSFVGQYPQHSPAYSNTTRLVDDSWGSGTWTNRDCWCVCLIIATTI